MDLFQGDLQYLREKNYEVLCLVYKSKQFGKKILTYILIIDGSIYPHLNYDSDNSLPIGDRIVTDSDLILGPSI